MSAMDSKLENYLVQLEKALKPFSVSDRSEIITEIKSHVLAHLERDPDTPLESILSALGQPETVANRYLLERGLKPIKPSVHPVIKWLVIGFLGTVGLFVLLVSLIIFRFTPLIEVDDKLGHVSLMGGLIKVQDLPGHLSVNGHIGSNNLGLLSDDDQETEERTFEETLPQLKSGEEFAVQYINGRVHLSTSKDGKLFIECKYRQKYTNSTSHLPTIQTATNKKQLDLRSLNSVNCEIEAPKDSHVSVEGTNGRMFFEKVKYHLQTKLTNGHIQIEPDEKVDYKYNIQLTNGHSDNFTSSQKATAYEISARLTNGNIEHGE